MATRENVSASVFSIVSTPIAVIVKEPPYWHEESRMTENC